MRSYLLCLAFVALLSLFGIAECGNCTAGNPMQIMGKNFAIEVDGMAATIFPVHNGVLDRDNFSLRALLFLIVERKWLDAPPGSPKNAFCWFPKFALSEDFLPFAATYQGYPMGEVLSSVDIKDFDCYTAYDNYQPPNGNGATVKAIRSVLTSNSSSFRFEALFELPSASFMKETYDYTNFTGGEVYTTYYRADTLKITYDLSGFPWGAAVGDKSFLSLHTNLTFNAQPGVLARYDTGRIAGFNWTREDGLYTLFMESDTSFVLDGYPYTHVDRSPTPFPDIEQSDPFSLSFITGTRVCENNTRWTNLNVDPFLGLLFNGETDITKPPSPSNKKSRLSTGAAVGIAIGAVAIVSIVIAVAVLSTKVTAVKQFFRPFTKRSDGLHSTTGNVNDNGRWTASKPVADVKNT